MAQNGTFQGADFGAECGQLGRAGLNGRTGQLGQHSALKKMALHGVALKRMALNGLN